MNQNLEAWKLTEKIKLSYLKHRGNVLDIAAELSLDITYIQKMVAKFKGKESRDVATLISNTLMSHLMLGYESRVHNLMEMLKSLEGRDKAEVSTCCESPIYKDKEVIKCSACNLKCKSKILDREEILDVKLGILEQLREEDRILAEFADKMGYTNKKEILPGPVNNVKQNILILNSEGKETKIITEASQLSPLDRDTVIDRLVEEVKKLPPDENNEQSSQT